MAKFKIKGASTKKARKVAQSGYKLQPGVKVFTKGGKGGK